MCHADLARLTVIRVKGEKGCFYRKVADSDNADSDNDGAHVEVGAGRVDGG